MPASPCCCICPSSIHYHVRQDHVGGGFGGVCVGTVFVGGACVGRVYVGGVYVDEAYVDEVCVDKWMDGEMGGWVDGWSLCGWVENFLIK